MIESWCDDLGGSEAYKANYSSWNFAPNLWFSIVIKSISFQTRFPLLSAHNQSSLPLNCRLAAFNYKQVSGKKVLNQFTISDERLDLLCSFCSSMRSSTKLLNWSLWPANQPEICIKDFFLPLSFNSTFCQTKLRVDDYDDGQIRVPRVHYAFFLCFNSPFAYAQVDLMWCVVSLGQKPIVSFAHCRGYLRIFV